MEPKQSAAFHSPLVPLQTPPQNGHTRLNILVVVLMIIFLSGMGLLAYRLTQPKKQAIVVENAVQPISSTKDETSEWQTYTNDDKAFSFKYPSTYVVTHSPVTNNQFNITLTKQSDTNEVGFVPIQLSINTATDENGDSYILSSIRQADEHYSKSFSNDSLIREDIVIDNRSAISITGLAAGPGPGEESFLHYTFIQLNNEVLVVQLGNKNYQDIFDKVLSTFKFIE